MLKQSIADGDIDRTMCAALEEGIAVLMIDETGSRSDLITAGLPMMR